VAVALGALVGSGGASRRPARNATSSVSAATRAAEVVRVLRGVSSAFNRDSRRLDDARRPTAEASAAAAIEHDYANAGRVIAGLPADVRNAARTRSIDATAKKLASLYRMLAVAAGAGSRASYADDVARITAAQATFRHQVRALS
jgi:hypothetical protein